MGVQQKEPATRELEQLTRMLHLNEVFAKSSQSNFHVVSVIEPRTRHKTTRLCVRGVVQDRERRSFATAIHRVLDLLGQGVECCWATHYRHRFLPFGHTVCGVVFEASTCETLCGCEKGLGV